jgi:hypothetical protein
MAMNGDKRDRMSRKVYKRAAHGRIRAFLRAALRHGIDADPAPRVHLEPLQAGRWRAESERWTSGPQAR